MAKNKEKQKETKHRHMQTAVGKTSAKRGDKKYKLKTRKLMFAMQASRHYPVFSSGRLVSEIALELVFKARLKLFVVSTKQCQEHVSPGQHFLTAPVTDNDSTREAFCQWTQKGRSHPAVMKNLCGHPVQERLVDPDGVENLSLERFTSSELLAMGWKWLPLLELDLDGLPTLQPAHALEQQCQILTHDLRLGSQWNKHVPGAFGRDRKVTKDN